uniref:AMP-binding protein n=1 Tax=Marivivens donghaensis TaxID=1699413 RepID=UPI003F6A2C21
MTDKMYPPSEEVVKRAHIDAAKYKEMYAASVNDPVAFWGEHGKRLDWMQPYSQVKNTSFEHGKVDIKWFEDGVINAAYNCVDRHLATRGDQTAIIFEPDSPDEPAQHITYNELSEKVNRFANVLLSQGVMRGDRVVIYLPMIPEAAYAMLACARIGAVHSIVFAGFSPDALANRINDSGAKVVITADTAPRGGRRTGLKSNCDAALLHCSDKVRCLVVKHTGDQTTWIDGRDVDVKYLMSHA